MSTDSRQTQTIDTILPASTKESIRHLELYARRKVEGLLHGSHPSKRIGVSTDFDHHTEYHPGDPLKHVDWKASARQDRFYLKRYLEDTALNVRLVVDRSASMLQVTGGVSKYDYACRMAGAFAYLVLKQNDRVGLTLTTEGGNKWLPASTRSTHLIAILKELISAPEATRDSLERCLNLILGGNENRGIIIIFSDLMFDPEPVQRELGKLHAQGHEVLIVQLRDPVEEDFPFNRWVQFHDLENSAVRHRLDPLPLARIYREVYSELVQNWREWAHKYSSHFITMRTDERVETALTDYLSFRQRIVR